MKTQTETLTKHQRDWLLSDIAWMENQIDDKSFDIDNNSRLRKLIAERIKILGEETQ